MYNFYYYEERKMGKSASITIDKLNFKTELSGGINPKLNFTTTKPLDVSSTGYSLSNTRTDDHTVTITLTQADKFSMVSDVSSDVILASADGLKLAVKKTAKVEKKFSADPNCIATIGAGDPLLQQQARAAPRKEVRRAKERPGAMMQSVVAPDLKGPFVGQTPDPAADEAARQRIERSRDEQILQDALRRLTE